MFENVRCFWLLMQGVPRVFGSILVWHFMHLCIQ